MGERKRRDWWLDFSSDKLDARFIVGKISSDKLQEYTKLQDDLGVN